VAEYRILQGDVLARLAELPDESVHCIVTSPPTERCDYIGIELNPEYVAMSERRLEAATAQGILQLA
jgi:DNA modification methylase